MEFLKIVKRRRSVINEVIYITLNIGLAISLLALVRTTGSIWPAFILVILSKWRVFAVRPQFWFANIQANLVSAIISFSYVIFLLVVNSSGINYLQIIILQSVLAVLDICWLLFLKPKSKRKYVVAQAGVALFVGITAIYTVSHEWIASPVVLLVWLVGYATARHVLNNYDDEDHTVLLSLAWGMILAEIGWLAYHWTIAYQLPIIASALLPQVSIIVMCLAFIVYRSYDSYYHHQKIRMNDILLPLIFAVGIISVLILAFNGATTGTF
jgi:hypothetical protein